MYPWFLGVTMAANGLAGLYSASSNYKAAKRLTDYQTRYYTGAYRENERFWSDYVKRHHIEKRAARYPYRRGYIYNLSSLYSAHATAVSRRNAFYTAGVRAYSPFGLYNMPLGYRSGPMNYNYMYR